jgi:hypothetical protein
LTVILKVFKLLFMTDHDRVVRTLVLCFVLAILALIPLRFMESKQGIETVSSAQVLGDSVQPEEVILPNAELSN